MATQNADVRIAFTFSWMIENCGMLLTPKGFESPVFKIDSLENTQWNLAIMDLNEDTFLYFIRRENDTGPDKIEIFFELQFLSTVRSNLSKVHYRKSFAKRDILKFKASMDIFSSKSAQYLENDTLTLRCRIWKLETEALQRNLCFARTRLGLERKTIFWKIEEFSTLPIRQDVMYRIESNVEGVPPLLLALYIAKTKELETVWIKILENNEKKFLRVNCEFSVLDVGGKKHFTRKFTHLSTAYDRYMPFFRLEELNDHRTILLPNDALTVRGEFEIGSGTIWNKIEHYVQSPSTEIELDSEI
ncbi:speckle-type POZ protein B [Nephila pilipes]|uniref:Speckle-type POZ protein B n=1 Tax=Nephila pilipes TaxID=299642 RepID=A0A8X6Q4K7_NEPPI|nr:speckle-type POZ protein B [Nephila pilipes]